MRPMSRRRKVVITHDANQKLLGAYSEDRDVVSALIGLAKILAYADPKMITYRFQIPLDDFDFACPFAFGIDDTPMDMPEVSFHLPINGRGDQVVEVSLVAREGSFLIQDFTVFDLHDSA